MTYRIAMPRDSGDKKLNAQNECLFLSKLPPEIRRQIYQHVMDEWGWTHRLHIVRDYEKGDYGVAGYNARMTTTRKRRLTYVPCTSTSEDSGPALSMCRRWPTQHDSCRGWKALNESPPNFQGMYLALFLTCRRVYVFLLRLACNVPICPVV